MCRALKSVDVRSIKSVKELLKAIDAEYVELAAIAAEMDFSDSAHIEQFSRNVTYLKTYFEHCERIVNDLQFK